MKIRQRLPFTAFIAVAALALPGAASAATFTHDDATHDVQRYDDSSMQVQNWPQNKQTDVTKTRIVYTRPELQTTVWVRSGRIGDTWLLAGQLRTSVGEFSWEADISPMGKSLVLEDQDGEHLKCAMSRHAASKKGRVTVRVPRSCLGNPVWVKEGVGFAINRSGHQFVDDGLRKAGLTAKGILKLSPRLKLKQ